VRRCRSWRYVDIGHTGHRPGGRCRQCWRPCRNRIPKSEWAAGTRRCSDCVEALLFSPEPQVRRILVDEPGQQRDVLVALTTDTSGPVAMAAQRRLEELDIQQTAARHGSGRSVWT